MDSREEEEGGGGRGGSGSAPGASRNSKDECRAEGTLAGAKGGDHSASHRKDFGFDSE